MRSMSLIDKSVPVEYRYAFSTAIATALLSTNDIVPNNITSRVNFTVTYCIIDSKINNNITIDKHGR